MHLSMLKPVHTLRLVALLKVRLYSFKFAAVQLVMKKMREADDLINVEL